MRYLIIEDEGTDFYTVNEISSFQKKDAKYGNILIVDLETKEFYVENDVWQKIPEK